MINSFHVGDRVTFNGYKGTICSPAIYAQTTDYHKFYCYLVWFDEVNDKQVRFENLELNYSSNIAPINEAFLSIVIEENVKKTVDIEGYC
jgi:signal peptidase I